MAKPEEYHTDNMGHILVLTLGNGKPLNTEVDHVSAVVAHISVACVICLDTAKMEPHSLPLLVALVSHTELEPRDGGGFHAVTPEDDSDVPKHLRKIYNRGLDGLERIVADYDLVEKVDEKIAKATGEKPKGKSGGRYRNEV